ncbi:MAG: beta strand repeat-containing protein, partial [Methylophagaceae bacterium]
MANDKKFIVKNGLLTPENAVIGSTTDTGEKLQVSGDTVLSQATAGTPTLKVTNSGGNNAVIGQFQGDTASLQVKNITTGDYQLVNTGQNNGIIFYNDTGGVSIQYNGGDRLVISNTGNEFTGLSNTTIDGNRILTVADEGAGNLLDADTVDGLEAAQFVRADISDIMAGSYTIQNNLVISGDLTVSGNTTTVNTEEILLADNIITLNSNFVGSSPTENGGIEIERGTADNAKLIWNETSDYWQLEVNNAVLGRIITTADEGSGNGFDADTVDGLEGSQFLRSDVDDVAEGNITIEGDLTIGDNTGPAQVFLDGTGVNRTLYSNNGEIGFLNAAANWAMKSDANGDLEVERDVEAGRDVTADRNIVAADDITATSGNISATAGSVAAGTTVTGGTGVTATTGNVSATIGDVTAGNDVTAGQDITATAGNIAATAGSVSAGTTVTGGTGVTATTGNVTATVGDVIAGDDVTAQNNITATAGNISATAGSVAAGTTVTAGTDVIGQRFVDADNNTYLVNPGADSTMHAIGLDDDLYHNGDTDTKLTFNTATINFNTDGTTRLTANNSGVTVFGDLDVNGNL